MPSPTPLPIRKEGISTIQGQKLKFLSLYCTDSFFSYTNLRTGAARTIYPVSRIEEIV